MPRDIRQVSFAGGEIAPSLHARTDLAKYFTALRTCRNFFVTQHGVLMNRPGTRFVHEVKDSAQPVRLIPFIFNNDQTFVLEFGPSYIRFYHDGGIVVGPGTTTLDDEETAFADGVILEQATPYAAADLAALKFTQMGDVITIVHPLHAPRELKRTSNTAWELGTITISRPAGPSLSNFSFVLDPVDRQYNPNQVWTGVFQGGEVCQSNGPSGEPPAHTWRSLVDNNSANLPKDNTWAWHDEGTDPPGLNHLTTPGRPAKEWKWVITSVDESGVESLPSAAIDAETYDPNTTNPDKNKLICLQTDRTVTLQWDAVVGARYYNVYRGHNGLYGYVGEAVSEDGLIVRFTDDAQAPDYTVTPPTSQNPFAAPGDYPGVVAYYQQRRWFGCTINRPQTIWGSKTGDYYNFDKAQTIPKADDAVEFTLASRQLEVIRNLIGLRTLLLLTSSGEWAVSGGQAGPITPSNVEMQPHGYRGSSLLDPIAVGNVTLFVQAMGNVVRELIYDFSSDSYGGNDLTVLAAHLFHGHRIVDWTFAPLPYSTLWAVREDGVLLGCTYLREHEMVAWHRHDTLGTIERVCAVPEGVEHAVYLVVKRGDKRYIERFYTRQQIPRLADDTLDVKQGVFLDCALTYSGDLAMEISGLDHLEGYAVMALADGNVCGPYVVENGKIDLSPEMPDGAALVHVGLGYVSEAETLDLAAPQADLRAKVKNVVAANVEVIDSRGLKVGTAHDAVREWRQRAVKDGWAAIAPYNGFIRVGVPSSYSRDARLILRQEDPLPVTIIGIGREVDVA